MRSMLGIVLTAPLILAKCLARLVVSCMCSGISNSRSNVSTSSPTGEIFVTCVGT